MPALMAQVPDCTVLTFPFNGETNVSVTAELKWAPVANATGYSLFIGTSPGSVDVVDGTDVGSALSYNPLSGWDPFTTYYVMVLPRNNTGSSLICPQQHFTTGAAEGLPGCVTLREPEDGDYGVAPGTTISWFPQNLAAGYRLSIGTITGTYDLLNNEDVGNVTSYDLPGVLPMSQRIYIRVVPYNMAGESPQCSEDSFRTRDAGTPSCTEIIDPRDGTEFVSVTANITWIREFNASGYNMTIEENSPGGIRLLDDEYVGSGTNFKPPNFKGNTTYYVTIVPFNDLGEAENCRAISFTTGNEPDPPECTNLLVPANGAEQVPLDTSLEWEMVPGARGYRISAGTFQGGNDLTGNLDVGPVTNFEFQQALPQGTQIYVRVTPYNDWGSAVNCPQWTFTTFTRDIEQQELPIPKFFTPNNDGFNDNWIVRSTPEIEVDRVWIYNRFGKLLKQINADQPWDGNYNGRPVASDSYWYRIQTLDGNTLTGFFMLKR